MYLATMAEILQSIRQAEITQILTRIQQSEGGTELLDVLMKYLYVRAMNISSRFINGVLQGYLGRSQI